VGKRQQRYFQSQIVASAAQLEGQYANIILTTNEVFGGHILSIDINKVYIKDTWNHKLNFPLENILEIITDHVAEY